MYPLGCPKTSITKSHYAVRNIKDYRIPYVLRTEAWKHAIQFTFHSSFLHCTAVYCSCSIFACNVLERGAYVVAKVQLRTWRKTFCYVLNAVAFVWALNWEAERLGLCSKFGECKKIGSSERSGEILCLKTSYLAKVLQIRL